MLFMSYFHGFAHFSSLPTTSPLKFMEKYHSFSLLGRLRRSNLIQVLSFLLERLRIKVDNLLGVASVLSYHHILHQNQNHKWDWVRLGVLGYRVVWYHENRVLSYNSNDCKLRKIEDFHVLNTSRWYDQTKPLIHHPLHQVFDSDFSKDQLMEDMKDGMLMPFCCSMNGISIQEKVSSCLWSGHEHTRNTIDCFRWVGGYKYNTIEWEIWYLESYRFECSIECSSCLLMKIYLSFITYISFNYRSSPINPSVRYAICWRSYIRKFKWPHNVYKIDELLLSLPIGFKKESHVHVCFLCNICVYNIFILLCR